MTNKSRTKVNEISAATRRASKMAGQAVSNAARKNWTDIGLYSLTFYGYIKANGKITVSTCVFLFWYNLVFNTIVIGMITWQEI